MIKRRDQGERGQRRHAKPRKHHGESGAGANDADVFDRGVREEPLHFGLYCGKYHTVHGAEETHCKDDQSPPPQRPAEQVKAHTQQAIHRDLQHHTTHEG